MNSNRDYEECVRLREKIRNLEDEKFEYQRQVNGLKMQVRILKGVQHVEIPRRSK